jgi:hypothetical protein
MDRGSWLVRRPGSNLRPQALVWAGTPVNLDGAGGAVVCAFMPDEFELGLCPVHIST